MKFTVSIEQFDGPLDLMLHLIKENKLDLFDLDMDVLANQYIAYIQTMKDLQLEVASEYLIELASLIEYKSKKLLPREKVEVEEDYEEDQREKLVARLLEYQQYKEMSEYFQDQYLLRQKHFSRPQASLVETWQKQEEDQPLTDQSSYELMKAMKKVFARHALLEPYETKVEIKEMSVEERLDQIINHITNDLISFTQLCLDCTNAHMVIVTFLALLDLIHQKVIDFKMDESDEIWVWRIDA